MDDGGGNGQGGVAGDRAPLWRAQEQAVFWGGKLFWAVVYVALPIAFSRHPWGLLLGVWALSQAITGWMLAFMFQVHRPPIPPSSTPQVHVCTLMQPLCISSSLTAS